MDINDELYNELQNGLNEIDRKYDNGDLNESNFDAEGFLHDFSRLEHTITCSQLKDGYIYESEKIYEAFLYYIKDNDAQKIEFLYNTLEKYYKGYIKEMFSNHLEQEEYELCEQLKKFI